MQSEAQRAKRGVTAARGTFGAHLFGKKAWSPDEWRRTMVDFFFVSVVASTFVDVIVQA